VNKGTITGKRLVSDISQATSFTPGDVEGLLAALESRISYYLSEGHHVQLGNMGHFLAGLTARPVMDKKEIHAQTIFFGKVHFRVSPGFRKQCAGFVERVRISAVRNVTADYARFWMQILSLRARITAELRDF